MKVTIEFPHEEEYEARKLLQAVEDNNKLLVCFTRIKKEMDFLIDAVEQNNYASQADSSTFVPVYGVDVTNCLPQANRILVGISDKINKILEEV